tara:strand:+ start:1458 stop:1739 length:282 start_codon:yes stop_codon:yes gene_type:complete
LLPNELEPYDILGNYNLVEQLRNSSELLLNQYDSLITACKKIHQIFVTLEVQKSTFLNMKKKANDYKPRLRSIEQIQKAFLEGFISIILIKCI